MTAMLRIDDLTKTFGGLTAVDDLSFAVGEHEILGFIGPNGAGKTTTFNCVMGVYDLDAGQITFKDEDITRWSTDKIVRLGIARTFQTARPLQDFTVAENIGLPLLGNGFTSEQPPEAVISRIAEIAENVGLEDEDLDKLPTELPHAGLLKLELGRSLAADPELILVDEIFAGLTQSEVQEFVNLLKELRESGHTFIVIDHNMRGLFELIDRAIVINFGQKVAEGTPEEIKTDQIVQNVYLGGNKDVD